MAKSPKNTKTHHSSGSSHPDNPKLCRVPLGKCEGCGDVVFTNEPCDHLYCKLSRSRNNLSKKAAQEVADSLAKLPKVNDSAISKAVRIAATRVFTQVLNALNDIITYPTHKVNHFEGIPRAIAKTSAEIVVRYNAEFMDDDYYLHTLHSVKGGLDHIYNTLAMQLLQPMYDAVKESMEPTERNSTRRSKTSAATIIESTASSKTNDPDKVTIISSKNTL